MNSVNKDGIDYSTGLKRRLEEVLNSKSHQFDIGFTSLSIGLDKFEDGTIKIRTLWRNKK